MFLASRETKPFKNLMCTTQVPPFLWFVMYNTRLCYTKVSYGAIMRKVAFATVLIFRLQKNDFVTLPL